MRVKASQQGLSLLGTLLGLAFLAFVVSTGLKVGPHYYDHYTLKRLVESAGKGGAAGPQNVAEFYSHVAAGMQVNNMRDLDLNKALSVTVEGDVFKAHLKYEKREPLILNLDVVAKFDDEISVRKP